MKLHKTETSRPLTPSTPAEKIIEEQLAALKEGDMEGVYRFASPGNKAQTGGNVENFSKMVRSGPYRCVVVLRKNIDIFSNQEQISDGLLWILVVVVTPALSHTDCAYFLVVLLRRYDNNTTVLL